MGKTPKPLRLLVDDNGMSEVDLQYFRDLAGQGHEITFESIEEDAIISPKAWCTLPEMNSNHKLYDLIIKGIRDRVYSKPKPKVTK